MRIREAIKRRILEKSPYLMGWFRELYVNWGYIFLLPYYTGRKFACPLCGGHFRKMFSRGLNNPVLKENKVIGGVRRLNSRCPRCLSFDRERLVYLYLKNKTSVFSDRIKLLHMAPERNLQKALRASNSIDYVSADLNSPLAEFKRDITNIKYKDCIFDVIICNHVLEHIPNDKKAMAELYRVLKVGGWAILQVPVSLKLQKTYEDSTITTPEEREKAFGQKDHVRIYGKDYEDRLKQAGFSVDVYDFVKELGEPLANKYALLKKEKLYICSRPN